MPINGASRHHGFTTSFVHFLSPYFVRLACLGAGPPANWRSAIETGTCVADTLAGRDQDVCGYRSAARKRARCCSAGGAYEKTAILNS
jgi:hypothetical protein